MAMRMMKRGNELPVRGLGIGVKHTFVARVDGEGLRTGPGFGMGAIPGRGKPGECWVGIPSRLWGLGKRGKPGHGLRG